MNYSETSTLIVIDSGVEDAQFLIQGIVGTASENPEIFVLNSSQDGISEISQILTKFRAIESLHIISHGQPGQLQLGTAVINQNTLPAYADQLQQWTQALAKNSSILLYGCRIAAGTVGENFVQALHHLTQVSIAASRTLTGNPGQGGDWNLDVQYGKIHASPPFQSATLATYPHILPTPNLLYGSGTGAASDTLKIINTSDGSATTVGTLLFDTFAIARDAITGRVYYIENINGGQVGYFDPATGNNQLVGNTGVSVTFYKLAQSVIGQIYGMDNTTSNLYTINQTTGSANSLGAIKVGAANLKVGSGDIAFDPNNPNRLFVTVPNGTIALYTVDIDPTSANYLQATLIQKTSLSITSMGALAFGADGQLYTVSNGKMYRLDPEGVATSSEIGTMAGNYSDFGSLPVVTPTADLQITVSDGLTTATPNSSITYTVTVINSSTTDLTGISVFDLVPPEITGVTWTAVVSGGGGFPTTADEFGTDNDIKVKVNLNAGASVTYTITGTVASASASGTVISNIATVSSDGINDPNPSNNTATDTTIVSTGGGPSVTVSSLSTTDRTPELTGAVSDPMATIKVAVNGQTYTATNNGNGTWTLSDNTILPANALSDGTYSVTVTAIDISNNVGVDATDNELIIDGPPTVTINPIKTGDRTPKLTGTVDDPNAVIKITVNGKIYGAVNNGDSTWTLQDDEITPDLADSTYDVQVSATDALSNTGYDATTDELEIDTVPIIKINALKTGDKTPQLTGTIDDPNAIVTVTVNGKAYSAINNKNGTWTLPDNIISPALADGIYSVVVNAKDINGNIGTDSTNNELTINATLPQVIVKPIDTTTGEGGGMGSFQAVLNRQPTANVVLTFKSSDATEGIPKITQIVFTPTNWNTPQTIAVIGVDDRVIDSNIIYNIKTSVSSTDSRYNKLAVAEVGMINLDNDKPGTSPNPKPPVGSTSPEAKDLALVLASGQISNISSLLATDSDSAIASYTIVTLPSSEQGVLYLGNPVQGGKPIVTGQVISSSQIKQLFFQSTDSFSQANFTYTATDITGVSDRTPATVVLSTEDCGCNCESGLTLSGTPNKNKLRGTPNLDRINGRKGDDLLHGWGCDDIVKGGSGKDRIFGDGGDDILRGGGGRDRIRGGQGIDQLHGGRGLDRLHGGDGDDLLRGQKQRDRLWGGQGNDTLLGGLGRDILRGNAGNDRLKGNRGRDRLKGQTGDDWLHSGISSDRLSGGGGNDTLTGGRGQDFLWGGKGNDVLVGGRGRDNLWGYDGDDLLIGGLKRDKLVGRAGNDTLIGGRRADRLVGGAGNDRFVYRDRSDRGDRIVDFDTADVIDLSRLVERTGIEQPKSWKALIDLTQVGSATVVQVDLNEKMGDRFKPFKITLENINANELGKQNFVI